jgi:hypothetical protein
MKALRETGEGNGVTLRRRKNSRDELPPSGSRIFGNRGDGSFAAVVGIPYAARLVEIGVIEVGVGR